MSSPDVRAGMSMIMAACVANGRSVIENVYQVERGYHNIAQKLASLGASIQRVEIKPKRHNGLNCPKIVEDPASAGYKASLKPRLALWDP